MRERLVDQTAQHRVFEPRPILLDRVALREARFAGVRELRSYRNFRPMIIGTHGASGEQRHHGHTTP